MSRYFSLLLYLLLLISSLALAALAVFNHLTLTRGVETDFSPAPQTIFGTNVALDQYASDAELQRAVDALKDAGFTHARQYFPWREIEAERGVYDWAKWDRIVNAARANGIQLVAVLHTAPAWSQRAHEREMPAAPPNDFADYARFVGAFAERYGRTIDYYQIWDEPNVEPSWGKRNADPVEYAQLLIPAAQAIRAADAHANLLLAGLAMNLELHRPHPNYSEILFLRGLYEIGANKYFDIVAAKPYGMWTGPEDRTINSGVLNFSRLVLLRDEMRQYGDRAKPIWAVEMGWNALPGEWSGAPSPWGSDGEEVQADRLARALARARTEWSWLTGLFPQYLQPNLPADNPRWGFALFSPSFEPRASFDALAAFLGGTSQAEWTSPPAAPVLPVLLLLGVAVVSAWRAWHYVLLLKLDASWRRFKARANALPELAQFAVLVAAVVAFYFAPNLLLNLVLLGLLILLFALRLDLGLALTVFVIPFWNFPKTLFGGFQLSPVEVLTWIATAAFLFDAIFSRTFLSRFHVSRFTFDGRPSPKGGSSGVAPTFHVSRLTPHALDIAVLAFLLLGLFSTRWAGNFGVASREFRIIVLDPILLYALVRLASLTRSQTQVVVDALLASGVAVCAIGLYQYLTGDVILADGIARLTAVWGSPNNVGLYLGRLLPLALAFAFLLKGRKTADSRPEPVPSEFSSTVPPSSIHRPPSTVPSSLTSDKRWDPARWIYAGIAGLFAVTILLTYSRGALFVGVPASVLFILVVLYLQSHHLSRRAWLGIAAALGLGALVLVPFLSSERFQSLFQSGTGTGFFRVAVWTSAINMIRDHLILGVGLDNFLYEYPKYILPEAWREPNLSHPHNVILDFWVRLGIGGVLLFVWMLVAFYRRAWRTFTTTGDVYVRALMLGLMASVVDMLAHGLIDASYFVIDLAYVFMLTLALAQLSVNRPTRI